MQGRHPGFQQEPNTGAVFATREATRIHRARSLVIESHEPPLAIKGASPHRCLTRPRLLQLQSLCVLSKAPAVLVDIDITSGAIRSLNTRSREEYHSRSKWTSPAGTIGKMFVLVIYDISDNRRRASLAKILAGFSCVQESAFEAMLTKGQLK